MVTEGLGVVGFKQVMGTITSKLWETHIPCSPSPGLALLPPSNSV